jgi:hypothetical protein
VLPSQHQYQGDLVPGTFIHISALHELSRRRGWTDAMDITNGLTHAEQVELFLQAIFVGLDLERPYSEPERDIADPTLEGVMVNAVLPQGEGEDFGDLGAAFNRMDIDDDDAGNNDAQPQNHAPPIGDYGGAMNQIVIDDDAGAGEHQANGEDTRIARPASKNAISFKYIREMFQISNEDINTLKVTRAQFSPQRISY